MMRVQRLLGFIDGHVLTFALLGMSAHIGSARCSRASDLPSGLYYSLPEDRKVDNTVTRP